MYRTTSPSSMGGWPMQQNAGPPWGPPAHAMAQMQMPPQGHPKIQGKRRRNTDPNKPKRPTSAYFYFMAHKREEMAKKGQSISRVADFTKEVSALWKNLSATERKEFDDKAAVDKKRYDEQMYMYKGKDADKPKRPLSSYFLWLAVFRSENKDKYEHKELLSRAGLKWKQLTDIDKRPYEEKADEEKKKYEVAMREYNMKKAKRPRMDAPESNYHLQQQVQQQQQQQQQQYHHQQQMAAAAAVARNGADDDDDEEDDDDDFEDDDDE